MHCVVAFMSMILRVASLSMLHHDDACTVRAGGLPQPDSAGPLACTAALLLLPPPWQPLA
jgi:hypothetical protein